jgi:sugar lactone lactonase YvrE
MRYDVQPDDAITNRREFLDVAGNDGMKVDQKGNLYSTTGAGPGEVWITPPEGSSGTDSIDCVPLTIR